LYRCTDAQTVQVHAIRRGTNFTDSTYCTGAQTLKLHAIRRGTDFTDCTYCTGAQTLRLHAIRRGTDCTYCTDCTDAQTVQVHVIRRGTDCTLYRCTSYGVSRCNSCGIKRCMGEGAHIGLAITIYVFFGVYLYILSFGREITKHTVIYAVLANPKHASWCASVYRKW